MCFARPELKGDATLEADRIGRKACRGAIVRRDSSKGLKGGRTAGVGDGDGHPLTIGALHRVQGFDSAYLSTAEGRKSGPLPRDRLTGAGDGLGAAATSPRMVRGQAVQLVP